MQSVEMGRMLRETPIREDLVVSAISGDASHHRENVEWQTYGKKNKSNEKKKKMEKRILTFMEMQKGITKTKMMNWYELA